MGPSVVLVSCLGHSHSSVVSIPEPETVSDYDGAGEAASLCHFDINQNQLFILPSVSHICGAHVLLE